MWLTRDKSWSMFLKLVSTLISNFLLPTKKETICSRFTNLGRSSRMLARKYMAEYWSSFLPIICWMSTINNGSRIKSFKELRYWPRKECSLKLQIKPLSKNRFADLDSKYRPWSMAKTQDLCWWAYAGANSARVLIFLMMQHDVWLCLEYHTRIIKLLR